MLGSFANLTLYNGLPDVIDDIIFDFAYGVSKQYIHETASAARSASFRMPVPKAWRLLVDENNSFLWERFLNAPSTILIDVEAVKQTLELINWNVARTKSNALSHYVRTTTKKSILCMLDNPITCLNPQTVSTAIHMVWHILSCCEPQDFKVE